MTTPRKRPQDKLKTGRKPMPIPRNLEQIEILAGFGLTDEEIAAALGVCRKTLFKWKKKDGKFEEALKKGKTIADLNVIKSLYTSAISGRDTTAAIFWLKNRRPDKWRDRHDIEFPGGVEFRIISAVPRPKGERGE